MKRFVVTLMALSCIFYGCKKKEEKSPLCDGKGSDSYWPIALGNSWQYSGGETDSIIAHWDSIYVMSVSGSGLDTLRITANGDIYLKAPGLAENLYLPGEIHLGKQWTGEYPVQGIKDTLTVVDINSVITSASCLYTGCVKVEIKWYFPSAAVKTDYQYFQKGVGNVYRELTTSNGPYTATLSGITLN